MVGPGRGPTKNIYLVSVLLWPQYIRRGTFFVSRKGTFSNALLLLLGDQKEHLQWPLTYSSLYDEYHILAKQVSFALNFLIGSEIGISG